VCQIFSRSVQGLRSSDTRKIAISHWLAASPLQQCTHCCATLWYIMYIQITYKLQYYIINTFTYCMFSYVVRESYLCVVNVRIMRAIIIKISPVGDWRSTSLEWPWPWFRPYGIPSCITHRPVPIYQISFRSEENFFWKSPLRFWSSSESRDTKTRTNIRNRARSNLDIVL